MKLGRIIGTVVATRKDESLGGCKLMVVGPLDTEDKICGEALVAVDTVGAGTGETVLYVSGAAARNAMGRREGAIDTAIVGIVDRIDMKREEE